MLRQYNVWQEHTSVEPRHTPTATYSGWRQVHLEMGSSCCCRLVDGEYQAPERGRCGQEDGTLGLSLIHI